MKINKNAGNKMRMCNVPLVTKTSTKFYAFVRNDRRSITQSFHKLYKRKREWRKGKTPPPKKKGGGGWVELIGS